MYKLIDAYSNSIIERVKKLDRAGLQAIIDRPFEPSPFNSGFDLEKFTASMQAHLMDKEVGYDSTDV